MSCRHITKPIPGTEYDFCTKCGDPVSRNRPKTHKFGAKSLVCRLGHRHPSRVEAAHCWSLQAQMKANQVRDLEYEKPYELQVNGILIAVHKPDFTFKRPSIVSNRTGAHSTAQEITWDVPIICVDEVKGFKTPDWVLKQKLFKAIYPYIQYRVIE